jgi:NADPH:quinone reductase
VVVSSEGWSGGGRSEPADDRERRYGEDVAGRELKAMFRAYKEGDEPAGAGTLRPTIAQTFPLERASDAHAAIELRATLGKTLLVVR